MKSIKTKITVVIICIILLLSSIIGGVSCYLNYATAKNVLEKNMQVTATVAAGNISNKLNITKQMAIEMGCDLFLCDPNVSVAEKKNYMEAKASSSGQLGYNIIDLNGKSIFTGENYSDRDYFKKALNGEAYLDGPMLGKTTGEYTLIAAAPLWQNGLPNTKVIGVIYIKPDLLSLSDMVADINIGESGCAYLLDKDGNTMAHRDKSLVMQVNSTELSKTDPSYKKMAEVEKEMLQGKTGFGYYDFGNARWGQAYAPIPDTNGWSVGVFIKQSEFLQGVILSIVLTIACIIIAVALGVFVAFFMAKKITSPILLCVNRIRTLVQGDLHSPVPDIQSKDETGILANSTKELVDSLHILISENSHLLTELSNGNLDVEYLSDYPGDFNPIQVATTKIIDSLNETMGLIAESANQVTAGSEQVSSSAQSLSQGSTEQASSTEELVATTNEIMDKVNITAQNAEIANQETSKTVSELEQSNKQMSEMLKAMEEISEKSSEISKIIKTIDDIAFQTNILALNAAVEAARAGEAGKGFSVVADEVRNLASKSAEAAKGTTVLIDDTVQAVENGTRLADQTAKAMITVVAGANQVTNLISEIAHASEEQASSINQIKLGVEQISAVVQTNSATAEESAAASEELFSQAESLRSVVSQFVLKEAKKEKNDINNKYNNENEDLD